MANAHSRKNATWAALCWIGFVLVVLFFLNETSFLLHSPSNNYERIWQGNPYWTSSKVFRMLFFALAALAFWLGRRRPKNVWAFAGLCCLYAPIFMVDPIYVYFVSRYYDANVTPSLYQYFCLFPYPMEVFWGVLGSAFLILLLSWFFARKVQALST